MDVIALIVEDLFEVKENARSDLYRFVHSSGVISGLLHNYILTYGSREDRNGYNKKEIKEILIFFKSGGIDLSLETEMWIVKGEQDA